MTRDGTYLVRDGEIAGAVKSMRFTQSYLEALAGTAAVGSDLQNALGRWCDSMFRPIKLEKFQLYEFHPMRMQDEYDSLSLPFLLRHIAAQQGQAVRLSFPDEPGIQKVRNPMAGQNDSLHACRQGVGHRHRRWISRLKPGKLHG